MPRRTNNKPKPKSKQNKSTRSSSENLRSFLGEGSAVEESSSETESFRSADLDGQTDYNLDFTSSHIQNRHLSKQVEEITSSAIRKRSAANRQDEAPAVSSTGRKKGTAELNAQSSKTKQVKNKQTKTIRKQPNPAQLQKKFWSDVRKLQNRTDNLIPRAPFSRIIREILHQESTSANGLTYTALLALQEAAEMYLTSLFQDSYCCTLHRGRVTLIVNDIELVRFLRGRSDPGNR